MEKIKKSSSPDETAQIGRELAKNLDRKTPLCFFGDLGTGKTTLIKALISEFLEIDPHLVNSPTFTYLHIYEGRVPVFHFDLYRLQNHLEFLERGFDEYFEIEGICCIEWAERIHSILPSKALSITMKHLGENQREIRLS